MRRKAVRDGFGWTLLAGLTLCAACPSDPPAPPPIGNDDGGDAAALDGGSPMADSGADDSSIPPSDAAVTGCVADDAITLGEDSRNGERRVSVAAGSDRFLVVWNELRAGFEEIFARPILSDGTAQNEVQITDDTSISDHPTAIAVGEGWLVVYRTNPTSSYELYGQALTESGAADGAANRITTNTGAETAPVLAANEGSYLLGWLETNASSTERRYYVVPVNSTGEPDGTPISLTTPPIAPEAPALVAFGDGMAALWFQQSGGGVNEVMFRLLDTDGSGGTATPINTENNATSGGTDMGSGLCAICEGAMEEGAGNVFSVQVGGSTRQVRFRHLDTAGEAVAPERTINASTEEGYNPSVAAFAGGFIATYRTDDPTPKIRAALIDASGDVVSRFDVAESAASGGPTTVRVTTDGAVLVAWADIDSGTTMRAARITCE